MDSKSGKFAESMWNLFLIEWRKIAENPVVNQ